MKEPAVLACLYAFGVDVMGRWYRCRGRAMRTPTIPLMLLSRNPGRLPWFEDDIRIQEDERTTA